MSCSMTVRNIFSLPYLVISYFFKVSACFLQTSFRSSRIFNQRSSLFLMVLWKMVFKSLSWSLNCRYILSSNSALFLRIVCNSSLSFLALISIQLISSSSLSCSSTCSFKILSSLLIMAYIFYSSRFSRSAQSFFTFSKADCRFFSTRSALLIKQSSEQLMIYLFQPWNHFRVEYGFQVSLSMDIMLNYLVVQVFDLVAILLLFFTHFLLQPGQFEDGLGLRRLDDGLSLSRVESLQVLVGRVVSGMQVERHVLPADIRESIEKFLSLFSELLILHLNPLYWVLWKPYNIGSFRN